MRAARAGSVAGVVVLGGLVLGGCAEPVAAGTAEVAPPLPGGGPPPVTVAGVDLRPFTSCWSDGSSGGCYDGAPQAPWPDLGAGEELFVTFPRDGWEFQATFQPADQPCGPRQSVDLAPSGAQGHRLVPAGRAGTYDVELFGSGPEGDVVVQGRWTTTVDGPLAVPSASVAVLSEHDGALDSYGAELSLDDMAVSADGATASVTVTSAEGRSLTTDLQQQTGDCVELGSAWFTAPAEQTRPAAALGSAPFTYDVVVVLGGTTHRASATWPTGAPPEEASHVPLVFDPPLPALG